MTMPPPHYFVWVFSKYFFVFHFGLHFVFVLLKVNGKRLISGLLFFGFLIHLIFKKYDQVTYDFYLNP